MAILKRRAVAPATVETSLRANASHLLSVPFPTVGAAGFGPGGWGNDVRVYLPGSVTNWQREAGPLWKSSVPGAAINLIGRTFPEAPPALYKPPIDGQAQMVTEHDFLKLLAKPNPYYGPHQLWWATVLSLLAAGNSYWLKRRDNGGRVKELHYVPHWMMAPAWPMDGSEFISHYVYRANGQVFTQPREDVVHFRTGLDPDNPRLGYPELLAQLRSIVGDNEADTYMAALLKNGAVPGIIIRPAASSGVAPSQSFIESLKQSIKHKFSGDKRGEPMALTGPVDIDTVGFNPEEMALDVTRQIFETRICAALGVPPALLGLRSGADQATYSNTQNYDSIFYEKAIIPRKKAVAYELQTQLFDIDFAGQGLTVGWDFTEVQCLQDDQDALARRQTILVTSGIVTPNEARQAIGMKPISDPEMDKPQKRQPSILPGDNTKPAAGKDDTEDKALARRLEAFRALNARRIASHVEHAHAH